MVRKILGAICLVIGGMFIMTLGMVTVFGFSRDVEMGAVIMLIYLVMATPFTLGGMALWDWSRWRILLGVTLTSAGGMLLMCAITIPMAMLSPEWEKMATDPEVEEMMPALAAGSGVSGVLFLAIGIALIIAQTRRDKAVSAQSLPEV